MSFKLVSCGAISQYNLKPEDRYGVKNLVYLFQRQLTIRGFLVGSIGPKYAKEFQEVSYHLNMFFKDFKER